MSKSKYPNQIDTPSELPIVRDNIYEIGSDAINSLRSAIIQIEKTLGINPNGAIGLTVGERISQSLDQSGNIKREAIDRVGLISGPIFDDQVSDSAAIKESKIKLNFPTQVLQSQISVVASLIDEIQAQVEQISSKLSAHLSPDAANRHSAKSISTTAISDVTSAVGLRSLPASNVQAGLESIFSSHINYDGSSISAINNSHSANQIYFDNSTTNVVSENVQDALEEVADYLQTQVVQHQNLFHGAGSAKASEILDKDNSGYGTILLDSITSSVYKNLGEKPYFEVLLDLPVLASEYNILTGDNIELTISSVSKEYQIYKVDFDTTKENILGFWLFGTFETNSVFVPTIVFSKRFRKKSNFGLLTGVRENYEYSSSNIAQIINLDAPYIESSGINANEISISNRFFDLKINGMQYSFDVYNSAINVQSIDSIIKKINETVDYLSLPILAYRVDKEGLRSEIVIAHNISSKDLTDSSLEIIRVDNSIDYLGFSSYENKIVYGEPGSSYYIAGERQTGLLKKLDLTGFDIQAGSKNINSGALAIDFINYGIKKGDIVNLIDTSYMNSYEITDVTSSYISVSPRQLPTGFPTDSVASARLIIYDSSVNISNSEFLKIGIETSLTNGSSLFEFFLDKNRRLNANLILEQESEVYASKSIYQILDFKNNSSLTSFQINFEKITSDLTTYVWLDEYENKKKIVGDNNYIKIQSNLGNFECEVFIPDAAALYNYADSVGGSFSKTIFLNSKINRENNLVISNIHYTNNLGKFDGGINGSLSVSKLNIGNIEEKDISTALKATLTELPIMELRSSGVVSGLKVSAGLDLDGYSSGNYIVSIEAGICYVEGKRFEVSAVENFNSGINSGLSENDKVYVGVDYNGNFVFSGPDPICLYPWSEEKVLLLATIENRTTYYDIIDQRLFINNLDLKLLNSITVSPQPGMGHFTNIPDAIKYAKRFSEIFPKAGIPEVHLKSGLHKVTITDSTSLSLLAWFASIDTPGTNERISYHNNIIKNGLFLDFPISIKGEGDSSIVEAVYKLNASDGEFNLTSGFMIVGDGFNTSGSSASYFHNRFNYGIINISNLYLKETGILGIDLVNNDGTNNLTFKLNIENITFEKLVTSTLLKTIFIISDYSGPFFYEVDNNTRSKGNIFINNCRFLNSGRVYLAQSPLSSPMRYKNITISNSFTLSSSGIVTPSFSDVAMYPSANTVWSIGNVTPNYAYSDRIASNIIVGGNATISGNIISDNYYFNSTKTFEKTFWIYSGQIPYDPGSSASKISAADPFIMLSSSSTRIDFNLLSGAFQVPSVQLASGGFLSVPVEIYKNQKLKTITVVLDSSSTYINVNISLYRVYRNNQTLEVVFLSLPAVKSGFSYSINYSYKPDDNYSHFIVIENTALGSQSFDRVRLTFESNNLFELIGIS